MMPALPGPGVSFSAAQLPMMTTVSASDGCHLYFEQGTLVWIEVYLQGDKRRLFYGRPGLTGITSIHPCNSHAMRQRGWYGSEYGNLQKNVC